MVRRPAEQEPSQGRVPGREAASSEKSTKGTVRWRKAQVLPHFQDVGKEPACFRFLFVNRKKFVARIQ